MTMLSVAALNVAVAALWLLRQPLSEALAARWFAAWAVPAHLKIAALSTSAVSLEDVTLGPPRAPDFHADRVYVRLHWSSITPQLEAITVIRPALLATLGPRGLSFGSLDRLLPMPGAPPAPLPDLDIRLVDGHATLVTRAGTLALNGSGAGRLRGGFAGRFSLADTRLQTNGCAAIVSGATITVTTAPIGVRVAAEGRLPRLACKTAVATSAAWRGEVKFPPDFSKYAARAAIQTGAVRAGKLEAAATDSSVTAEAVKLTNQLTGQLSINAINIHAPSTGAGASSVSGPYSMDPVTGEVAAKLGVTIVRASAKLPLQRLHEVASELDGTLADPLAAVLTRQLDAASRDFMLTATVVASRRQGVTSAAFTRAAITARTGARLLQRGRVELNSNGIGFEGGFELSGGGLPGMSMIGRGSWRNGWPAGSASVTMTRWTASNAAIERLRLDAVAAGDSVTATGDIDVSGRLGDGAAVKELDLPVAATFDRSGNLIFGERCLPVTWSRLSLGTVRLAAGRVVACPAGAPMLTRRGGVIRGGAQTPVLTLRGEAGEAPLTLIATAVRIGLTGPRLTLKAVTVAGQVGSRRGRATIDGSYDLAGAGGGGRMHAAMLDDLGLPVLVDDAATTWRLAGAKLMLIDASARIVDRAAPARFQPLRATKVKAALADGVLLAQGDLRLAAAGTRLGGFNVRHDLGSGSGTATLETGPLAFGPTLQPYEITDSLRGIVANVRGPVSGRGRFDWTSDTLTSHGTLRIDKLALATEALGPVDGIDGEIMFDDLLVPTTPPGQTLRIGRINPGVAVDDGVVVFRMLGPDAVAIDSIVWPYAGGQLSLAPVTIRSGDLRRDFLLTVDGLDAQQFLQRFEIKNLNVTGRFDGRLPLVFADGKGRIAGGGLVARPGGGLVQYVGEIGTEQVGAAARLAFDALHRMRYHDLTLDLDGDLDGELVTQVHFAGRNETVATLTGGPLPVKATGLPFRFGITVRAPFRALLGTAATFSDVRPLLHNAPDPVQRK